MNDNAGVILRISAKLAKKIHLDYEQALPPSPNPFLDWSADLFTANRAQYILISNPASLYSVAIYGKGVTRESRFFGDTLAAMRDVMRADGFLPVFEDGIAPAFYPVALAKRENRSVIGSMNDFIFQTRLRLARQDISPYGISSFLNSTLMSYIDYRPPREEFQSMVREYLAR
jgi:hypothetical protein